MAWPHIHRVLATIGLIASIAMGVTPAHADVFGFDQFPAGTVINDALASVGVTMIAVIGRDTGDVIAEPPCLGQASAPNVLSHLSTGECPSMNDSNGFIRIDFINPQNRVAIKVVHLGEGAPSYLKVFDVNGNFFDEVWGEPGPEWVGVPQQLVLAPDPDRPRIHRIEIGARLWGDHVWFDDLEFDVVVANDKLGWGPLKAHFR